MEKENNQTAPEKPTKTELAQRIIERVKSLLPEESLPQINEPRQAFELERIIAAVFNECNRDDLPEELEFLIVETVLLQIEEKVAAAESNTDGIDLGLIKNIKMGETTYEFNTKVKSGVEQGAAFLFAQLQPRLYLFEKVKSL